MSEAAGYMVTWTTCGALEERYEYDAYGSPYILEPNFATDPDGKSDVGNPYLFTGRRVDFLDNGSLTLQYNRHRYYDYYTGSWTTEDPLGYIDGANLYQYVLSNPTLWMDPYGFFCCDKCKAGDKEYTIVDRIITPYGLGPAYSGALTATRRGLRGLDIVTLARIVGALSLGVSVADIVTEIGSAAVNARLVRAIGRAFGDMIARSEESGAHAYLKVNVKTCKKERCCLIFTRYNWKSEEKYYQCTSGSVAESGTYQGDPGDHVEEAVSHVEEAVSHLSECEIEFGRKFDETRDDPEAFRGIFIRYP